MSFDTEACGARIRELRKGNKLTHENDDFILHVEVKVLIKRK